MVPRLMGPLSAAVFKSFRSWAEAELHTRAGWVLNFREPRGLERVSLRARVASFRGPEQRRACT